MPQTTLPSPADGDRTRANQREALAGVLPLERRDQLAALLTDQGSRHRATRRKNALVAGRESGARTWAILASLTNTAKLNDLDPHTSASSRRMAQSRGVVGDANAHED